MRTNIEIVIVIDNIFIIPLYKDSG